MSKHAPEDKAVRISAGIPATLAERLQERADFEERTVGVVIKRAIEAYLNPQPEVYSVDRIVTLGGEEYDQPTEG